MSISASRAKFGVTAQEQKVLWAPLYERVLNILGSTGLIIPLGDTNHENSGRTTCTTVGDEAAVFTYSEAVTAFDTAISSLGPARIPEIAFNASDEELDSPDAAFWTRDDAGGANGMSIGFWGNVVDTSVGRDVFTKRDDTLDSEAREWDLEITSGDDLRLEIWDESANVSCFRTTDATIIMGSMTFFVATYDGAGGASAADTIVLYQNGSVFASTATNDGSYVGMEDLGATVGIGAQTNVSGNFTGNYNGTMAGGPLGPFWTTAELTADEVLRLYQLGRAAMNL